MTKTIMIFFDDVASKWYKTERFSIDDILENFTNGVAEYYIDVEEGIIVRDGWNTDFINKPFNAIYDDCIDYDYIIELVEQNDNMTLANVSDKGYNPSIIKVEKAERTYNDESDTYNYYPNYMIFNDQNIIILHLNEQYHFEGETVYDNHNNIRDNINEYMDTIPK